MKAKIIKREMNIIGIEKMIPSTVVLINGLLPSERTNKISDSNIGTKNSALKKLNQGIDLFLLKNSFADWKYIQPKDEIAIIAPAKTNKNSFFVI